VPFSMSWKGKIPAGSTYDFPILNLDILPTAVTAAGGKIEPADSLDGVDLLPYVTGANKNRPHDTLYWRFGEQWAIRKGDMKLVASRIDGNKPRLIDLAKDIAEANDLSSQLPDKVKELEADWKAWSDKQAKPSWQPNPTPKKKNAKKDKDEEEDEDSVG
jgi:arylsulfatase A-like enzyme